jgi:hypothetical protein
MNGATFFPQMGEFAREGAASWEENQCLSQLRDTGGKDWTFPGRRRREQRARHEAEGHLSSVQGQVVVTWG